MNNATPEGPTLVHAEEWPLPIFPPTDLPYDDGVPLESNWHRLAMNLLIESVGYFFRDRNDFFVGGNMFLYYSVRQARNRDFRGPDFFFVWGVERNRTRDYWAVWDEDGKSPDAIIELTSPTTAEEDRTTKKAIYERTLKIAEYFLYDPATESCEGWRLGAHGRYEPITADERGWLWSDQVGLWLGKWAGAYLEVPGVYPRFYDKDGKLVLIGREDQAQRAEAERQRAEQQRERAEQERQRAEQARQRADAAEAELARLKARLAELEGKHPPTS